MYPDNIIMYTVLLICTYMIMYHVYTPLFLKDYLLEQSHTALVLAHNAKCPPTDRELRPYIIYKCQGLSVSLLFTM